MKILFITHDASRSGAPILLRNFLGWIKKNTNHKFETLYRVGGPLEDDFEVLSNTDFFYPKYYNNYETVIQRILNRLGYYKFKLKNHHIKLLEYYKKENFDIIYSNTIVNLDVLLFLKQLNIPIITHVRELESTIDYFGGKKLIKGLDELNQFFIGDSYSVKENLIKKHQIASNKIDVVHEYVEIPEVLPTTKVTEDLKKTLNLPNNAFIVGASGGGLWRKGYDLFIQAAIATCKQKGNENVYFIWVGGFKPDKQVELDYDIEKSGLKDKILFVGAQKKPLDYFSMFDVFILASREEPFGIVGMESALFETPIICFKDSGGMPEFITDKCGLAVPYLDIPKLVEAILFFKQNPELRKEYGLNARNKVLTQHTLEIKSKELLEIMENQL
ncbi:glycosyltransferase family 4 protein [Winogradskyella sp. PAMC22761]|nr:glycosyltransferase family 4 protein [Winogradskyella sp. PAMC22761]